jgi:hypothetical protein
MELILQEDPFIKDCPIIVMCGAQKVRANWYRSIPRVHVIDPDIDFLKMMVAQQNEHIKKYADMGQELPSHLYVNLILDDIALSKKIMKSALFSELVAISRNLGMRIVLLAQYLIQVAKENRHAFDGVGLVGTFDAKTITELAQLYAPFLSKDHFAAVLSRYTQNRGLVMCDKHASKCFYIEARWPFESWMFGLPSQKAYSDKIMALLVIQRQKEIEEKERIQREEEECAKLMGLDKNESFGCKKFVAENGRTFVFAPNKDLREEIRVKPIEWFVDMTIDADQWKDMQHYDIIWRHPSYYVPKPSNFVQDIQPKSSKVQTEIILAEYVTTTDNALPIISPYQTKSSSKTYQPGLRSECYKQPPKLEYQQQTSSRPEYQQQTSSRPEYQQPTVLRPEYQQPTVLRPEYQQPTASRPEYQQPTSSRPEYQQPTASRPEYQQPAASRPEYQQPTSSRPEYQQSAASRPEYQQQSVTAITPQLQKNSKIQPSKHISTPVKTPMKINKENIAPLLQFKNQQNDRQTIKTPPPLRKHQMEYDTSSETSISDYSLLDDYNTRI